MRKYSLNSDSVFIILQGEFFFAAGTNNKRDINGKKKKTQKNPLRLNLKMAHNTDDTMYNYNIHSKIRTHWEMAMRYLEMEYCECAVEEQKRKAESK